MRYSDALEYDDARFRRLTGIKKSTFQEMLLILTEAHRRKKAKGGRPNKLQIPEMLMMALEYLREYRTYFHIGAGYGLSESNAYETIRWVEDTLIRSGAFTLPGKKAEKKRWFAKRGILELSLSTRPRRRWSVPKKAKTALFGQKEAAYHTIKAQVVVDKQSRRIVCTAFDVGRCHDFRQGFIHP